MGVCRPLFSDEEHAALQATVSTTEIFGLGRMTFCQPVSYTQPISANVYSENRKWTWLQIFPSPSPSPSPAKMDLSPDSSTTSLALSVLCRIHVFL